MGEGPRPLSPAAPAPLILSLELDEETFGDLDALRRAHFPPERNFLSAHLTLFHALPGEKEAFVRATLAEEAAPLTPLELASAGYRFLGRGVALDFHAPELVRLRARLAARFAPDLKPQDQQKLRPHVTIQNKVDPATARTLFERARASYVPRNARGTALLLWYYRGGPWELAERFAFGGAARGPA